MKAILVACLPLCGIPLYTRLDLGWGNTVVGSIVLFVGVLTTGVLFQLRA